MTKIDFRSAAFAALALGAGLASSPAFAQAGYAGPFGDAPAYADPVDAGVDGAVPPNVIGQFTCAFNERHTHLERENCGGIHYDYGR